MATGSSYQRLVYDDRLFCVAYGKADESRPAQRVLCVIERKKRKHPNSIKFQTAERRRKE
jgi:hypothetical protein